MSLNTAPIRLVDAGASGPLDPSGPIDSSAVPAPPAPFRMPWVGLITLSAAVFLSVTSEMMPTGLLPDMSAGLGVSESAVGLLVSVFAFTVVLTSTPLAALTKRIPRHALLVGVLVVFAASNLATALAPSYEVVVASRILGGLSHGLFWAVVGAYAGHLVPRELLGRAVAITLGGGTLAFVLGVPTGTALGHAFGWRLAFGIVAGLTLVGALLVWRFLPPVASSHEKRAREDAAGGVSNASARRRPDSSVAAVAVLCVTTATVMIGHYAFYTFIAPFLTERMGVAAGDVGPVLFGYGVAGAVGLVLAGSIAAKRPSRSLVIALVLVAAAMTALALLAEQPLVAVPAYLIWGVAFGMLPPLLQTRLLSTASPRIRDTASAVYTTAFNAGIGGGALLGSVAFDAIGIGGIAWIYISLVVVALGLVALTIRHSRARA